MPFGRLTVRKILDWHLVQYPLLGPADIYKLLHQGVFGPGHIITSRDAARDRVAQELGGLEPNPGLPEFEPVDTEGELVRVNLAPLLAEDFVPERLADALAGTAAAVTGDPAVLHARLADALDWTRDVVPHLSPGVSDLIAGTEAAGFPARHHSLLYSKNYQPAYRVVLARLWPGISNSD